MSLLSVAVVVSGNEITVARGVRTTVSIREGNGGLVGTTVGRGFVPIFLL